MPRGRERPGLGLTVSDHRHYYQVRVVEGRAESVRHAIAQFTAFMNRPGGLGCAMATHSARKGKHPEELERARLILTAIRVYFRIDPFEPGICQHCRRAMARTRNVEHIQVEFVDEPVQMNPNQSLAGIGAPVAQQTAFDVFGLERLSE